MSSPLMPLDLFSTQKFRLEDIFKLDLFESLHRILTVEVSISTIIDLLLLCLVSTQTPKSMRQTRNLLIPYYCFSIFFGFATILYKNAALLPLPVFHYQYMLGVLPPKVAFLGLFLVLFMLTCLVDLLLCMVIQRYFAISDTIVHRRPYTAWAFLGGILLTNLCFNVHNLLGGVVFGFVLTEADAHFYLQQHIQNPEALLQNGAYFIIDVFEVNTIHSAICMGAAAVYVVTRLFGLTYFAFANIYIVKQLHTEQNRSVRREHTMLMRLLILEMIVVLGVVAVPGVFAFASIGLGLPWPGAYLVSISVLHLYPYLHGAILVVIVKPYRIFVCKLISKVSNQKISVGNSGDLLPSG